MERIELIPLAHLRESPFNPRKTYPEAELAELAESIASQGVLQPIVVRPLPEAQTDIEHTHELVFGHRRFRAAQLAELEEIPCIVRDLSDRDAAIAQTHENAKRADVTPFEEADSFAHLMDQHGLTADQVAAAVGKSRSYVYGRLKLHNAAPVVREAFAEQGLSAEIALELARIPNHKVQAQALKRCKGYGDQWLSTREAKNALKHQYVFDLKLAPFDLGDATLDPSAGACHNCPKASFNDPDLATEPGHFCIDQACYQGKEVALRARYLDDMAAAGHTVLEGDEAKAFMPEVWRTPAGYTRTHHAGWVKDSGHVDFETLCAEAKAQGIEPPKRTLVVLDEAKPPFELVAEAALDAFHAALGLRDEPSSRDERRQEHDPMAGWSAAERLTRDRHAWERVKKAAILKLRGRARTVADLRLVLHVKLDMAGTFGDAGVWLGIHGDDDIDTDALHDWINKASPDQLAELLVADAIDEALGSYAHSQECAAERVAVAEHYGVDVLAYAQPAEPAPTPSPAARAPEDEAADAPAAPATLVPTWPLPKKTKGQKVDAGGAAAVERAEVAA